MSLSGNLSDAQKQRIREFITEGMDFKQQAKDINDSLKDLTSNLADELGVDKKALTLALNMAIKGKEKIQDNRDIMDDVDAILSVVGILWYPQIQ